MSSQAYVQIQKWESSHDRLRSVLGDSHGEGEESWNDVLVVAGQEGIRETREPTRSREGQAKAQRSIGSGIRKRRRSIYLSASL